MDWRSEPADIGQTWSVELFEQNRHSIQVQHFLVVKGHAIGLIVFVHKSGCLEKKSINALNEIESVELQFTAEVKTYYRCWSYEF